MSGAWRWSAVVLTAAAACWQWTRPTASRDEARSASAEEPMIWGRSERRTFDLDWRIDGSAQLGGLPGLGMSPAATRLTLAVTGELELTRVRGGAELVVFARVTPQELKYEGAGAAESRERVAQALSGGAFARMSPAGAVTAVILPAAAPAEAMALWRSLWAEIQWRLPDGGTAAWSADESDPVGPFVAAYEMTSAPDRSMRKEKRSTQAGIERHGSGTAVWDAAAGWPNTLSIEETYTQAVDGQELARGAKSLKIKARNGMTGGGARGDLAPELALAERKGRRDDLLGTRAWDELARVHSKQQLGQHDDTSLQKAVADDMSGPEGTLATETYLALKARFILDDAAPEVWRELITGWGARDPRFFAVAEVLGAAGTPACQAALRSLIERSREDFTAGERLVPILAMGAAPTPETMTHLRSLSRDDGYLARDSAVLGLGAAGRNLRKQDAPGAAGVFDDLSGRLEGASRGEQGLVLAALGNLGDARQTAVAKTVLAGTDADTGLKVDAARSLRFVATAERDDLLASVLAGGEPDQVRGAAAYALSFDTRSADVNAAERAQLLRENDTAVAQQLVHNIARQRTRYAENTETLAWVAREHRDENTRRLAAGYLLAAGPKER